MSPRISGGWRTIAVAALVLAMPAGCSPSSNSNNDGAATPAATSAATPMSTPTSAATTGSGDYCSEVMRVNNQLGTMNGKQWVSPNNWTQAQIAAATDYAVAHSAAFVSLAPPELKAATVLQMQWYQAVKDAGYNIAAAKAPAGFVDAAIQISAYGKNVCGFLD